MFEKLSFIEDRYDELSKKIADPDVISDQAVFAKLCKEQSDISPIEEKPGYKEINLRPHPCKELGFVKSSIESRNGEISVHWYYKEDMVYYEFDIPEGVKAHLTLPSGYTEVLEGGKYHFAE